MARKARHKIRFARFFSTDSPKAVKADKFGYLNAINYMAPHKSGSTKDHIFNLCAGASAGCIELCLGRESGQAAMVSRATGTNSVRDSRERKARYFMTQNAAYMCEMMQHIAHAVRDARGNGKRLVVRPNGSTDIAYERIRVFIDPEFAAELSEIANIEVSSGLQTIFSAFPRVQFVDYTKIAFRFTRPLPANYDLTFSRSEINEHECDGVLASGRNVAVVFGDGLPATWHGYRVINGDEHDLRHLDPKGVVVGLSPKGHKANRSTSGFIVRNAIAA